MKELDTVAASILQRVRVGVRDSARFRQSEVAKKKSSSPYCCSLFLGEPEKGREAENGGYKGNAKNSTDPKDATNCKKKDWGGLSRLMTDRGMLRIEEAVGEEVHRDGRVESKPS